MPEEHGLAPLPPEPQGELTAFQMWDVLGLSLNARNLPDLNEDNVLRVLDRSEALRGRFWFDTFHQRMMTSWRVADGGSARALTDADVSTLTVWFQRKLEMRALKSKVVDEALRVLGAKQKRSEPAEWLRGLTWDHEPRLSRMLPVYFGTEDTPYTRAVAENWMTAMVARVMRPGCQVQTMVVLEGGQGRGKSRALRALGGDWFSEATENVQSKDFIIGLQGKLLVEIGEMDAFRGAALTRIKQVVSNETDYYRGPYERRASDHPRQCVFVGTTNDNAYLGDPTGARRFWPVRCRGFVDVEALQRDRAQLFAEAFARWADGATWWQVPMDEAVRQQESRRVVDEWETLIRTYVERDPDTGDARTYAVTELTVVDVLGKVVQLPKGQWGPREQQRVGHAFKALGWVRRQKGDGTRVYVAPGHHDEEG